MKTQTKKMNMKPKNVILTLVLSTCLALALLCAAAAPKAFGVVPAPDGGYPGFNAAEGQNALLSLTSGIANTGVGWFSLKSNTEGNFNTAIGAGTLLLNTGNRNTATGAGALLNNNASDNTATGAFALFNNTTGSQNTANGAQALLSNTTGVFNTAIGDQALLSNTDGSNNTATGDKTLLLNTTGGANTASGTSALLGNTTGSFNTANGAAALTSNSTGESNTATGFQALLNNTEGSQNTANGYQALFNSTGSFNVALGAIAGFNATTGNGNVYIGQGMVGVAGESNHTYIRNIVSTSVSGGDSDFVTVDLTTGLLGHASSSRRYKEDIKPMDNASQALFALKPVTFRYRKEIDQSQSLEYGLIAEEVAQVDPSLAIRGAKGQIENVRYSAVNAMLLNEFLKEHKKVQEQQATIVELKSTVAQQRKDFETATTQQQKTFQSKFAEQERQIQALASGLQKVSAQIEISKSAPQVVTNSP